MTTAILILAALNLVVTVSVAGVLLYMRRRRDRGRDALLLAVERLTDRVNEFGSQSAPGPSLVGKTVVINTKMPDDQTVRGVVYGQYPDRWTLRNAVYVTGVGETAAPGLVHVPVANVSALQEPEAA